MYRKSYAFKYDDDDVLKKSSSGGAFSALSDYILNNNGVVYGAVYDYDTNVVHHEKAVSFSERNGMCGSKYIQSKMGDIYQDVENVLREKKRVLFTGTICQIAGLKRYLGLKKVNCDSLICCDVICHGVASPLIWKDYINYKLDQIGMHHADFISFRDKSNGWTASHTVANIAGKIYELPEFMSLYYSHTIMRNACHSCRFANLERVSDITIGDFWGIEKTIPTFDHRGGASYVMVNTEKGQSFFTGVLQNLECAIVRECKETDVSQPNFAHPAPRSVIRDRVWREYNGSGIDYIVKEYVSTNYLTKLRVTAKKIVDTVKEKIQG